jgi:hypothetical protein
LRDGAVTQWGKRQQYACFVVVLNNCDVIAGQKVLVVQQRLRGLDGVVEFGGVARLCIGFLAHGAAGIDHKCQRKGRAGSRRGGIWDNLQHSEDFLRLGGAGL